ncbi:MAG: hypothetical protein L6Q92_03160 [Phycisphaerae bacterium]|nr:hypothetical protein [Phycisphaerae bacterium]
MADRNYLVRNRSGRGWPPRALGLGLRRFSAYTLFLIAGCAPAENPDARRVRRVFGETGLGQGQFSYPRALALSPVGGRVFVCDKAARIQRFAPDGRFETGWRMPEWEAGKPTGISIDARGCVWVADTHYSRVIVFDADGSELFRFGSAGEGPGQFLLPTFVTWDKQGRIYVGEYGGNDRISVFSPELKYIRSFAARDDPAGATDRPQHGQFDDSGVLWVTDTCHHRICRYDQDGRFLGSFGNPGSGPGELNYPYALALIDGPPDTLVVADQGNNRVVEFSRDGRFLRAWGSPGRDRGQVYHPWAVAWNRGDRELFVLDSWNNRVQVLDWSDRP